MKPILIVPSYEKGRGGGHLSRCTALAEELRSLGRDARIYTPADALPDECAFIVLDRFRTSQDEFLIWRRRGPVIGIDEGGSCRNECDFLIDILPNLEKRHPNRYIPALLRFSGARRPAWDIPRTYAPKDGVPDSFTRTTCEKQRRVLITFGAEDAAGLTAPAALALAAQGGLEVTAVFGALNRIADTRKAALMDKHITVADHIPNLSGRLAEYDLVVTHFGLTAFESLYARVPVLLVSPTAYHEKLARNAGFRTAGCGKKGIRYLKTLQLTADTLASIQAQCRIVSAVYGIERDDIETAGNQNGDGTKELAQLLNAVSIHAADCPVCGARDGVRAGSAALARFHDRTYRICPVCGITYMSRVSPPPVEYAKDYFFDFYKKQYGKTYIEDFPNLVQAGKRRLSHIVSIIRTHGRLAKSADKGKLHLLDIGCAYGPFLAAAKSEGFAPVGLEAAEDAVSYVNHELGIPCFHGYFPLSCDTAPFSDGQFDVISLWYVIEHFEHTGAVLSAINRLLKKGGVLAFSTPSFEGVSARGTVRAQRIFLEKSPQDHYTLWSPSKVRAILKPFGFALKKIVITGHHPERFPVVGKLVMGGKGVRRGVVYRFLLAISRLFGLGDTFEVYAVKIRPSH
ncbi:MAG: class I SAM-dependent methyltransferase [Treponema sp.]|jgi:2-polyprenyl-3-methyl-5-hydroxy-6-metoxy-1,4-benzoquinol methylase/spore coat polysaccharide biosynthesis predicted glycosyltransferase SpsG|nr:class I SAM-dependent methyltransferase [Treponema sp.]